MVKKVLGLCATRHCRLVSPSSTRGIQQAGWRSGRQHRLLPRHVPCAAPHMPAQTGNPGVSLLQPQAPRACQMHIQLLHSSGALQLIRQGGSVRPQRHLEDS